MLISLSDRSLYDVMTDSYGLMFFVYLWLTEFLKYRKSHKREVEQKIKGKVFLYVCFLRCKGLIVMKHKSVLKTESPG